MQSEHAARSSAMRHQAAFAQQGKADDEQGAELCGAVSQGRHLQSNTACRTLCSVLHRPELTVMSPH